MAAGAVAGIMGADMLAAVAESRAPARAKGGGAVSVKAAITLSSRPEDVYAFWHDFQNLPRIMAHLESVELRGEGRSHWKAKAPAGRTVEWDAEVVEDRPNELIAWRALEGADVDNRGSVRFDPAPGERGTEVRLELEYTVPGGVVGATIAKLFGEEPEQQVKDDLRRFKQQLETGQVVHSEGSPEGTFARRQLKQRPAQPLPTDGADDSRSELVEGRSA